MYEEFVKSLLGVKKHVPPEQFRVVSNRGGAFEAGGRLPNLRRDLEERIPPAQRLSEHRLTCYKITPGMVDEYSEGGTGRDARISGRIDSAIQGRPREDLQIITRLLKAERRQHFRVLWAAALFGPPTHRLSLLYTLSGATEPRVLIRWDYNFRIPESKLLSDQVALKVCNFFVHLLTNEEYDRSILTATEHGIAFWHCAVESSLGTIH